MTPVNPDGVLKIHKITAATDPGYAVNPWLIERQVAGSFVYGLSAALYGEITTGAGAVQQSNFHDYPLLRLHEMPTIEVYIVPSTAAPTGTGEPSLPPAAPAVANAIFAATGKRLRKLPFKRA